MDLLQSPKKQQKHSQQKQSVGKDINNNLLSQKQQQHKFMKVKTVQEQLDSQQKIQKANNDKAQKIEEQNQQYILPFKSSLCRFYLRGNCPHSKKQCLFAHGIQELNFTRYEQQKQIKMKQIYYDFRANHPFNQLQQNVSQQNKNYVNLYEFQCELVKFHYNDDYTNRKGIIHIKNDKNKQHTQHTHKKQKNEDKIQENQKYQQKQKKSQKHVHYLTIKQQRIQQKQRKHNKSQDPSIIRVTSHQNQRIQEQSLQHSFNIENKKVKHRHQYQHTVKIQNKLQNSHQHQHQNQQYSPHKLYTLQQINSNRSLKIQIRKKFHKHQFRLFLQLIQKKYYQHIIPQSQYGFIYDILQLQYYRVGFNKLMTRIKISFITDYLQYQFRGGYFKFNTILIPYLNKSITYYLKMATQKQIISHYKKIYEQLIKQFKQNNKQIRQQDVKLAMMRTVRDWWSIPNVIQFLRLKHCTFKDFIINYILKQKQVQGQQVNIQKKIQNAHLDWITNQTVLIAQIFKIIEQEIENKQYCLVSTDILAKNPKYTKLLVQKCVSVHRRNYEKKQQQNLKVQNPISEENKIILIKCPNIKTQIITKQVYLKPQAKYDHQFGIGLKVTLQDVIDFAVNKSLGTIIKNNKNLTIVQKIQKMQNNQQQIPQQSQNQQKQNNIVLPILKHVLKQIQQQLPDRLQQYKIIDIKNAKDLSKHSNSLLNSSTILGVDLQGSLIDPQTGQLTLIQINHYSYKIIYLIDYLTINKNQTLEGIRQCKFIIAKILNNDNILKIIHDSRNDSESLYNLLKREKQQNKQENIIKGGKNNQELDTQIYKSVQQNLNLNSNLNSNLNKNIQDDFLIKFTNIFDTAASEQVIRQFQDNQHQNLNTPGLNEVLIKYKQLPNRFKQKFHTIWQEGKQDPGIERPMSEQFREYCAMDVLGLPKVYIAMSKKMNPYFLVFISQLHSDLSLAKDSKRKAIQKFHGESQHSKGNHQKQSIKMDKRNQ